MVGRYQGAKYLAGLRHMVRDSELREGELAVDVPASRDAGVVFIGRIRTPWTSPRDTFSLRPPQRPNPIGTSVVKLVGVEGSTVFVRGLDCLDETPLIDLK